MGSSPPKLNPVSPALTIASTVFLVSTLAAQAPSPGAAPGRSPVYAPHGVVATSQPLATAAGLAVLEGGGNAFDAAVTAAAVLNLVEPHMTGIGGDMFALIWSAKESRLIGLNASGRSGAGMTRDVLLDRGEKAVPTYGAESITVPGALSGWAKLLEHYGTITLAQALGPAIQLAEEGFPVSPIIAQQWADETERLQKDEGARATFLIDGVRAPKAGEWFKNPDLARTFRAIAAGGPDVLYGGELGQVIVNRVQALGGFLTLDDLMGQTSQLGRADLGAVQELPRMGAAAQQPGRRGAGDVADSRALRPRRVGTQFGAVSPPADRGQEARLRRSRPVRGRSRGDEDPGFPALLRQASSLNAGPSSNLKRAPSNARSRGAAMPHSETIYLTVADAQGNMVSFINSLYDAFGSGVVVPGTGFALQNRGSGFTIEPGLPNTVAPSKLPFHTLIPGFVTRSTPQGEEAWMSFGVMGGSMQPQGHVQVLLNLLVFGMNVQDAIDAPRFRHLSGLQGGARSSDSPIRCVRSSQAMGHQVVEPGTGISRRGTDHHSRWHKGWEAGSDHRKDGQAAGINTI